jgi:hypothetical protein
MRKIILFLCAITVIAACENEEKDKNKNENNVLKGLVYFSEDPYIENDTLKFKFLIQYGTEGEAKEIEYLIKDSTSILLSSKANAFNNIDGMKMAFYTELIKWPLAGKGLSGKTLTVYLDPENKVTSEMYTSDVYVELYKIEEVVVP